MNRFPFELWRIDWQRGRASPCFGAVVTDGVVTEIANIGKWANGKQWTDVRNWYECRGATVLHLTAKEKAKEPPTPSQEPASASAAEIEDSTERRS